MTMTLDVSTNIKEYRNCLLQEGSMQVRIFDKRDEIPYRKK